MSDVPIPEDWCKDPLSKFLNIANLNNIGVFDNYREWFSLLNEIYIAFDKFLTNALSLPVFLEPFFFQRACSAYLATVRLASSGELAEAHVLMRSVLEYSLYAIYINKDINRSRVWIKRNKSDSDQKTMKKNFQIRTMIEELERYNPDLAKKFRELYEFTIDVGAHPNPRAILRGLTIEHTEDMVLYNLQSLDTDDLSLTLALKKTAQVGICSLLVFKMIFPERFEILGISADVDRISHTTIKGIPL